MDLTQQTQVDAVWQRVRKTLPLSFCAMAGREAAISALCRQLYRMGAHRRTMGELHRQSVRRRDNLLAMARFSGEPDCRAPVLPQQAELAELVRQLGLAAADYDPGHPIYGTVFSQFREECARGQRALLSVR